MAFSTINISNLDGSIAACVLLCIFIAAPIPIVFYFGFSWWIMRECHGVAYAPTPMLFYYVAICVSIPMISYYQSTHNLRNWYILHSGTTYTGSINDDPANFQNYQYLNLTGVYLYGNNITFAPIGSSFYTCYGRYGATGTRIFCAILLVPEVFDPDTQQTALFAGCETICQNNFDFSSEICTTELMARDTLTSGNCFNYWYNFSTYGQGKPVTLSKKLPTELPNCQKAAAECILNDENTPILNSECNYATEIVDENKIQYLENRNLDYTINTCAIIFSIIFFLWIVFGVGWIWLWTL